MDAAQTEKMKALALAATPGEWQVERLHGGGHHNVGIRVRGPIVSGYAAALNTSWSNEAQAAEQEANAEFIAASCPATVLELIADHDKTKLERDELRAEVERLRADARRYQWLDNKTKRDGRDGGYWGYYVLPMLVGWSYARGADSFDYKTLGAAIDAAIEKEKA